VQTEENESETAQQAAKEAQLSHETLRQRVEAMREELRLKDEACLELEEGKSPPSDVKMVFACASHLQLPQGEGENGLHLIRL
jgi:hypothetical protein